MCVCTCVVKGDSGDVISSHMDGSFSVPQVSELITPQSSCLRGLLRGSLLSGNICFLYSTCNISFLCMCQIWRVE